MRVKNIFLLAVSITLLQSAFNVFAAESMTQAKVNQIIKDLDEKTNFEGDYKAIALAHTINREKGENVQKIAIYRRDSDDRMMLLFLQPKADAGKGYLMIDKNFFSYEPSTGVWTRVSDERVGGSALNRANFNGFEFENRFTGKFIGYEKLGKYDVVHLSLEVKEGVDADEAKIELWIETKNFNVLKQQDFALSGRLLRTTYRTNYQRISDAEGKEQFIPMKSIVKDEVEIGNQTTMVLEQIDTEPLEENIFTKAWLESKSR